MLAHKPDSLPLAANARFTEDSKDLKLGEGLWKDVTHAGGFRQDYLDVKKQIAASHVGNFTAAKTPFSKEAYRVENGFHGYCPGGRAVGRTLVRPTFDDVLTQVQPDRC